MWGNCGPHTVQALRAVFDEWGILTAQLPPRTTSILQVMDLVVNGPVNTPIRKARCDRLMDYMQDWKRRYALEMAKPAAERCIPAYDPPKPTQIQGLQTVISALHSMNANQDFQHRLRRVFVTVGQAPDPDHLPGYTFCRYPGHDVMQKLGRMEMRPVADTLSDMLSQVSLTERDADLDFL